MEERANRGQLSIEEEVDRVTDRHGALNPRIAQQHEDNAVGGNQGQQHLGLTIEPVDHGALQMR